MRSAEGTQQGDPLSMLLFAFVIQPLILSIDAKCQLDFNVWCADDGTIVGDIDEVAKAYRIILDDGAKVNFKLVKSKTSLWWPNVSVSLLLRKVWWRPRR
eukprot:Plantae.Rhodophyta-Palmaria_palmata.ctg299.p1 GENE.Plantae.Rhodophyta-Palmaria_palmata.ctg299~~Plantae.Rhodophyta-Palmaria_palmata.ctg299.p1  ORF type:complete len:100 (-),score=2.15 Plantae.Rhodophyta-Palmaria_palmata.ctg299:328-627(-)